ncbi:sugar phosphate isomerase/epimerase family protein [Aquisphaera insulae]|uniref:sugar phosphate isomerase/epimerase family protein n=1 Tax=Aquisphaera insulae TaxID=2712864 RepID=UPI0013EE0EC6|nr:sugar phosphate isomerase/epimerase family protein [Aquisphaera insulae]
MKLRLACADFTFPLLSHDQSLRLIAMLGFEGVDIGLFEGRSHLWPSREFVDVSRSAGELRRKADDLGLDVADVFLQLAPDFRPCAINHPEPARRAEARDTFLEALDYASVCGCRHVTILPGVHFEEEGYDASFGRTVEELAWRVDQAGQRGIALGTEAHVGSIAPDPAGAERLVTGVPGLTLTLDYTHFTRAGLPDSAIEPLLAHAGHFHVRGARPGRLQASFKDNVIDYGRVVDRMRALNYPGWVGVEYVWTDWEHCNECDNLSETILFRDFLRGLPDRPGDSMGTLTA